MVKFHVFLQELVGADHNVGFTFKHPVECGLSFFRGFETRQHIDFDRPLGKAVSKVLIMLLCEQGSRYEYGDLFTTLNGHESGAHGNFGFTKANITTHQTVHRAR